MTRSFYRQFFLEHDAVLKPDTEAATTDQMLTLVILCDKLNNVSVDGYTIEAEAGANLIETTRIASVIV